MKKKTILIVGAKSKTGLKIAKKFAEYNYNIIMSGRKIIQLESEKKNLEVRYNCKAKFIEFDILKVDKHKQFLNDVLRATSELNNTKINEDLNHAIPDLIVFTVGKLILKKNEEEYYNEMKEEMLVNYLCPALLIELFCNKILKSNFKCTIMALSSVAGDRGRSLNYPYGSAKSGLTQFLSGLRQRTFNTNLNIITVIPGYIDSEMGKDINKVKFLTSSADEVANLVYNAYKSKSDIVYTKYWRFIMYVIKLLPEFLFKRFKF